MGVLVLCAVLLLSFPVHGITLAEMQQIIAEDDAARAAARCGEDWVTFSVIGYTINGKYTAYKEGYAVVTRRKSDLDWIVGKGATWRINMKRRDDVDTAFSTTNVAREALVSCLEKTSFP